MKIFLTSCLFLTLLQANELGVPKMPQMILKSILNPALEVKNEVAAPGCFSLNSSLSWGEKYPIDVTDFFDAQIECQVSCRGKLKTYPITEEFNPAYLGLFEGDGTSNEKIFWRSIGQTLDVWSKDKCYEVAKKECPAPESFSVKELKSGTWKMGGKYNCKDNRLIYSPFAQEVKVDKKAQSKLLNRTTLRSENIHQTPLSTYIKEPIPREKFQDYIIDEGVESKCQYRAKVSTCFGDCLFEQEGDHWPETLATTEPLGDYKVEVCLDKFSNELKKQKTKSEKDLVCHKLIWEIFMKTQITGTSCMAFRYDYECPDI